jgi:ribonuclease HI
MELTAAIMAFRALKYPCRVELHTDSTYLKNAYAKGWLAKWQKNGWKTS